MSYWCRYSETSISIELISPLLTFSFHYTHSAYNENSWVNISRRGYWIMPLSALPRWSWRHDDMRLCQAVPRTKFYKQELMPLEMLMNSQHWFRYAVTSFRRQLVALIMRRVASIHSPRHVVSATHAKIAWRKRWTSFWYSPRHRSKPPTSLPWYAYTSH